MQPFQSLFGFLLYLLHNVRRTLNFSLNSIGQYFCNINYGHLSIFLMYTILLSGDVEQNPGPEFSRNECFAILHQNIRSIRNKMEYIKDNFLDFDIICFTETHLSADVHNDCLLLDGLDEIFRKDISAHSSGFLVYVKSSLLPKRVIELETIFPESIWIEITDRSKKYLICNTYRQPHIGVDYWDRFNLCIERGTEITPNIIILGDINEDQLNLSNHKLRDLLSLNNMNNIITEPTRITDSSETLLDPIAVSDTINIYDSGIFVTDKVISDHFGTYAYIQIDVQNSIPYKRRMWNYKRADFNRLNDMIGAEDWSFLRGDNLDTASESFISKFLDLAKSCIPTSLVEVRPNDRPWYNTDIRRKSRQRDRQKELLLTLGKHPTGLHIRN